MVKLAVSGCCGKMGSRIINLALKDKDLKLVVALERKGHPEMGNSIGEVNITDNPEGIKDADVLVEFTNPQTTLEHLEVALRYKRAIVVGTTGITPEQKSRIKEASGKIPIVFSPNMSIGVNILFRLVKEAAEKLKDYHIGLLEAHHIHKKDAPSGTAKRLAEIINETADKRIEDKDINSIRKDEIIGDHEVSFNSPLDTIKLTHSAKTRDIFAQGALRAAKWVIGKNCGLYSMQEVLGY